MSNAMFAAIKRRREQGSGDHGTTHSSQHADDKNRDEPKDEKNDKSEEIAKGKPSTEEHEKIQAKIMDDEDKKDGGIDEAQEGEDSDAIAMDMLDSRFKNNPPSKPRNLHERAQMGMAKNLKSKGKI